MCCHGAWIEHELEYYAPVLSIFVSTNLAGKVNQILYCAKKRNNCKKMINYKASWILKKIYWNLYDQTMFFCIILANAWLCYISLGGKVIQVANDVIVLLTSGSTLPFSFAYLPWWCHQHCLRVCCKPDFLLQTLISKRSLSLYFLHICSL